MVGELSFKNLPFVPEEGEVIYVEQSYHKKLNQFIRKNYKRLRKTFARHHLRFCYLPLQAEETIRYYAPYLTTEERQAKIGLIPSLLDYVVGDADIKPSLVFALDIPHEDAPCDIVLQLVSIDINESGPTCSTFDSLEKEIEQVLTGEECDSSQPRLSIGELDAESLICCQKPYPVTLVTPAEDSGISPFHVIKSNNYDISDIECAIKADFTFDYDSRQLIEEIKERVEALRNKGINTMFLHKIIDESEHLSRLRITKDYRIFLVDYQNMEIKLPVLPKAVFLLFLQHPEGIRFKELTDYYSELLQIYLKMNPIGGRTKQEQSIRDITNPCHNSINEKCARIREAFVRNFDDRLAKNYYITGKRGEPKRITLDKSMIIWE